jgi:hypothetical protein
MIRDAGDDPYRITLGFDFDGITSAMGKLETEVECNICVLEIATPYF